MKCIGFLATLLLIIGGLNWGLVGLADYNAVTALFGTMPMVQKVIYGLVGLSAIYKLLMFKHWAACCHTSHTDESR